MSLGKQDSAGKGPVPIFSATRMMATPEGPQFNLDLITPPSSDESVRPAERYKSETPRSHRTSSLNTEFKKCRIYCDETATLTPIEEERTLKRPSFQECHSPRKLQKRLNKFERTDLHYYDTTKKKPQCSVMFCDAVDEESKNNSPIKIETAGNSWTLHFPPWRLNTLKSGANGRKDILTDLHKRNLYLIIKKIFNYLHPLDLVAVKDVSTNWRNFATVFAHRELEVAKKMALRWRENLPSEKKMKGASKSRNETTPLKPLVSIENRIPSPKRRIPVSPELSPVSKRFCNLREGKGLTEDERLERCPKCRYPAVIVEALVASCSRCSHTFCSRCRSTPHPNNSCKLLLSPTSANSPPGVKRVPIGSKQSKRSLTRLIQI